jgi:hypothetical protein
MSEGRERWLRIPSCFRIANESYLHARRCQTGLNEPRQKGRFMTHEEHRTKQEYMWQALSGEQSMTLTLAVEMLLRCHLSPYQILTKTMTALEGSDHDS